MVVAVVVVTVVAVARAVAVATVVAVATAVEAFLARLARAAVGAVAAVVGPASSAAVPTTGPETALRSPAGSDASLPMAHAITLLIHFSWLVKMYFSIFTRFFLHTGPFLLLQAQLVQHRVVGPLMLKETVV